MAIRRLAELGCVLLVILGLAGGFLLIGSPAHERHVSDDEAKVQSIQTIVNAIQRRGRSPNRFDRRLLVAEPGADSIALDEYRYERIDAETFMLCTDFAERAELSRTKPGFEHGSGRTCYTFSARPDGGVPLSQFEVKT